MEAGQKRLKRIEVLVFDGCPNLESTLARAHAAVAATNVAAHIDVVRVESEMDATRLRFLGSPSVRVDGVDVDPAAADRGDFGLQCLIFSLNRRLERAPPLEWIVAALV